MIRTSRFGFALTAAGAFVAATLSIVSDMWNKTSISDAMTSLWQNILGGCVAALFGATVGGLLALYFGIRLSRQYCWLFAVTAGFFFIPVSSYILIRTTISFPAILPRITTLLSFYFVPFLLAIGGGIALGVVMTKRRLGFSKRSRRASFYGLVSGAGAFGLLKLAWFALDRFLSATNTTVGFNTAPTGFEWYVGATLTLGTSALFAVGWTERYEAPRFPVLISE